jgi:hypothetical protein
VARRRVAFSAHEGDDAALGQLFQLLDAALEVIARHPILVTRIAITSELLTEPYVSDAVLR